MGQLKKYIKKSVSGSQKNHYENFFEELPLLENIDAGFNRLNQNINQIIQRYNNELIKAIVDFDANKISEAIKNGADPNFRTGPSKYTPLMIAFREFNLSIGSKRFFEVIDTLLKNGSDPTLSDSSSRNVIHVFAIYNHIAPAKDVIESIKLLMDKGVSLIARDIYGEMVISALVLNKMYPVETDFYLNELFNHALNTNKFIEAAVLLIHASKAYRPEQFFTSGVENLIAKLNKLREEERKTIISSIIKKLSEIIFVGETYKEVPDYLFEDYARKLLEILKKF